MKKVVGFERFEVSEDARVYDTLKQKWLSVRPDNGGYHYVYLTGEDGKKHYRYIYRLVAHAYLDNPENKPQVNHISGDKTDNSLSNLEWVTDKENKQHAKAEGLMWTRKPIRRTIETVEAGLSMYLEGSTRKEVAQFLNMRPDNVNALFRSRLEPEQFALYVAELALRGKKCGYKRNVVAL